MAKDLRCISSLLPSLEDDPPGRVGITNSCRVSAHCCTRDRPRPAFLCPEGEVVLGCLRTNGSPFSSVFPHTHAVPYPRDIGGPTNASTSVVSCFFRSMMEGYVNELERKLDGDLIDALDSSIEEKIESNHREKKR